MKFISIFLLIMIILLIFVNIVFLFYFKESREREIKEEKLSPEFLRWLNQSRQKYNFNNSYVRCLFERMCNGTFYLKIEIDSENDISIIENILEKYGKVDYVRENLIWFKIKDLYEVNNFFNHSFIMNITLYSINPDKLNIFEEELSSCKIDEDCVFVKSGCCGCSSGGSNRLVNKRYLDNYNSYNQLSCSRTLCTAIISTHPSCLLTTLKKCINNSCEFIPINNLTCNQIFYDFCVNNVPKSLWNEYSNYGQVVDGSINCIENVNLCKQTMTQKEIYERCVNKTIIPEKYSRGYIVAAFDPNATEDEVNYFINNFEFNVQRRFNDYGYLVDTPGGEYREEFIKYLKSFLGIVKEVSRSENTNHLFVMFYGEMYINDSKKIIGDYRGFVIDPNILRIQGALIDMVNIKVPEGEEVKWICKLQEKEIIYNVIFKT